MFGPPSSPPVMRSNSAAAASAGLLPAFVHQSSSPQPTREFLRPKFAIYQDQEPASEPTFLPTPVPTSEANAPASSSPPVSPVQRAYRPTQAKPLKPLVVAYVPLSGASVTLGRSSKSSTFALSARNMLASRVHARLSLSPENFVVIECLGWNGLTVSVPQETGGRQEYEVDRGQVLNVERMDGITIEVHGDKTLVEFNNDSEETEEETWKASAKHVEEAAVRDAPNAPKRSNDSIDVPLAKRRKSDAVAGSPAQDNLADGSARAAAPAAGAASPAASMLPTAGSPPASPPAELPRALSVAHLRFPLVGAADATTVADMKPQTPDSKAEAREEQVLVTRSAQKRRLGAPLAIPASTRVEVPQPPAPAKEETPEPSQPTEALKSAWQTPTSATGEKRKKYQALTAEARQELENVAVNFIAFSRLSAVPLATVRKASTQLQNLPKPQVRELIREIKCIGVTDAQRDDAGRLPEDEYYYIPELDDDESRRTVVQSTRGHRSLRSCRKTRKQYFYRPLHLAE